jgi:hypothetical protein
MDVMRVHDGPDAGCFSGSIRGGFLQAIDFAWFFRAATFRVTKSKIAGENPWAFGGAQIGGEQG